MSTPHQAPVASMSEFNTSLPSIRRIQSIIREKSDVEVKLLTGDDINGKVLWIDDNCICIEGGTGAVKTIIWLHAVAYIK
ncbi:Hfq-related RNA-binding protein [Tumidithrix helvetica PCC 7403]|uniref:Hfq-related RNA-binding protein n=1 Tax=Tumidithrix helvetica TaxID=3457545 RepID=UPI003C8FA916